MAKFNTFLDIDTSQDSFGDMYTRGLNGAIERIPPLQEGAILLFKAGRPVWRGSDLPFTEDVKGADYTIVAGEFVRYSSALFFTFTTPILPFANQRFGIKNVGGTHSGSIALDSDDPAVLIEKPYGTGGFAQSIEVIGVGISLVYQFDGNDSIWRLL